MTHLGDVVPGLGDDLTVAHLDGAVGVGGGLGVVGDHEDGLAETLVEVAKSD